MGLKLRMLLAVTGLGLSSMFGVNMLSGIKDYVDTTGNIMVDIADGIGMVSKGIEALEYYLDPTAEPAKVEKNLPVVDPPAPAAVPGVAQALPPLVPVTPDQPAVFCQKGKCYPYDPNRLKGVNLEAKPGMIIQAAPTPTIQKTTTTPHKLQTGHPKGQKGVHTDSYSGTKGDKGQTTGTSKQARPEVEPASPVPPLATNSSTPAPTKQLLAATRGLLERLSKLLVKVVHRIFPWNRRARRRVLGDGEDEEL